MAWTYNDWPTQSTAAAKLERLRQHQAEVQAEISASVAGDGYSKSSGDLVRYLEYLERREQVLEGQTQASRNRALAVSTRRRR